MSKFKITVARIEVNARREQDAQVRITFRIDDAEPDRLAPMAKPSATPCMTETDCVAGHVDGVSGLVAAVSGPLGGCASD